MDLRSGWPARHATKPAFQPGCRLQLRLLDGFELACGHEPIQVQPHGQRLLAFLALNPRPLLRPFVASTLWTDVGEQNAQASLRSTLWRLRQADAPVVEASNGSLRLGPDVDTDVRCLTAQARRVLAGDALAPREEALGALRGQLLPGWYDEWVLLERERLRQLQLHALDRLTERLLAAGRVVDALDAGMTAVAAEPLRESAQRLVIMVHLAEGNRSEALRRYAAYRQLLAAELGVTPSPQLERLVAGLSLTQPVRSRFDLCDVAVT